MRLPRMHRKIDQPMSQSPRPRVGGTGQWKAANCAPEGARTSPPSRLPRRVPRGAGFNVRQVKGEGREVQHRIARDRMCGGKSVSPSETCGICLRIDRLVCMC